MVNLHDPVVSFGGQVVYITARHFYSPMDNLHNPTINVGAGVLE